MTYESRFKIGSTFVPNEYPKEEQGSCKIVLVGEAPGEDEESERRPFIGASGNLLFNCLRRNGLSREEVGVANLCNYRPAYNKFESLTGSSELQSCFKELCNQLRNINPTVIGALGNWPLYMLTGKGSGHKGISVWRGSILPCIIPGLEHVKVVPTYHPAYIIRDRPSYPIFDQDIHKLVLDSAYREFNYPEYKFVINPDPMALSEWSERLAEARILAVDIESVKNSTYIICVGFSPDPYTAVVVPWTEHNIPFIRHILESQAKKVFHFGSFDTEMLWLNGIEVSNYCEDTLVMQHVLNPELPRSLDYLCSIYTRQPYYKKSGRGEIPSDQKAWSLKSDRKALYEYNGTDCCVTFKCFIDMEKEVDEAGLRDLYEYEISLLEPFQQTGRTGLPIDLERRALLTKALGTRYLKLQHALETLAKHEINVRSPKLKAFLYDELKLPPRRNREGGLTTGEDAIVSLIGYVKNHIADLKTDRAKPEWSRKLAILTAILKIRGARQLISNYLNAKLSYGNYIRSVYKVAATETGRAAGERYVDGTGFNPQTLPRTDVEVTEEDLLSIMPGAEKVAEAIANEEAAEESSEEPEVAA